MKKDHKPDLVCLFCSRIKSFESLKGYFAHLVKNHKKISTADRLYEMRRAASLWREYWDLCPSRAAGSHRTEVMLKDLLDKSPVWDDVLAWKL